MARIRRSCRGRRRHRDRVDPLARPRESLGALNLYSRTRPFDDRCAEQAFQSLARASQRENRKVRDLATEMIDRVAARPRRPIAS